MWARQLRGCVGSSRLEHSRPDAPLQEGAAAADAVIQLWYSTAITAGQRINTLKTLSWALGGGADSRTGSDLQAMPCRLLRPGEGRGLLGVVRC